MSKPILITGANGLLGYNLIKYISNNTDYPVIGVSKNSPPKWLLEEFYAANPDRFTFVQEDVSTEAFGQYFNDDVSYVFHLAGYSTPAIFTADPVGTLKIHMNGTKSALSIARRNKTRAFIAGSSEVYGNPQVYPTPEIYEGHFPTSHIRAPYMLGKQLAEVLVHAENRIHGADHVVGRIALATGPGLSIRKDQRLISDLFRQALDRGRIDLKDSGKSVRAYINAGVAADMIFNILTAPQRKHTIYNIGGSETSSVREIAEVVGGMLDAPVSIPFQPDDRIAPDMVHLDMTRYTMEFGAVPYRSLKNTLADYLQWNQKWQQC